MSLRCKLSYIQYRSVAILTFVLSLLLLLPTSLVHAKEGKFYAVAGAGYAFNDIYNENIDEVAYQINVGYGLGEHWSLEVGAKMLASAKLTTDELDSELLSLETDIVALQLSALGKASNRNGELFYRLGLAQVSPDTMFTTSGACQNDANTLSLVEGVSVCENNETQFAGVLGIGFDYYLHHSVLLRVEAEHIQGQDDYTSQAFYLGLRYNF